MIAGTFQLGGDQAEVIIKGNDLLFRDTSSGTMTTIHGLKLSKAGVFRRTQPGESIGAIVFFNIKIWTMIRPNKVREHE